ncbi:hypothetical protein VXE29_18755, partial [Acinetobacter variabilis]
MFQLAQDSLCGTGNFTRRVDIFNAYQPATLPGASLQIAAKRSNQRTKMKLDGRRGGEATNIVCVCHLFEQ